MILKMRETVRHVNQKHQEANQIMLKMQAYWPYGSPMPHTPGYQPVEATTDLSSKSIIFNQSTLDLVKIESAAKS